METEQDFNEKEYAKGFNWAYIIAEGNPKLAKELHNSVTLESDLASGLHHGFNEFFHEREVSRQNELADLRGNDKNTPQEMEQHQVDEKLSKEKSNNTRIDELDNMRGDINSENNLDQEI